MKIEEHPGSIVIETPEGKLCLTTEESWELLEWLYTHRGKLFAFAHHLQHFPEAHREAQSGVNPGPTRADKDGEPFLEDCEWCHGAHYVGQVCPLNTNRQTSTLQTP